jgi:uncharacterized membrane protein YkvI
MGACEILRKNIAIELAASYVGAVVGAGFASGQEQMYFFFPINLQVETGGLQVIYGVFSAGLLFVLFGAALGELAFRYQTSSLQEFLKKLVPWPLCMAYDGLMSSFIFWSLSIMLAGSGMLFKQSMGLSKMTGIVLTALFTIFAAEAGIDGLLVVNLIMSPFMVLMPTIVAVLSIWKKAQGFLLPVLTRSSRGILAPALSLPWPLSGLLYVSYNVLLAVGVFASMGRDIPDEVTARRGGVFGGIALLFFLFAIQSVLASYGKFVVGEELPMLKAASYHGVLMAKSYALALWFAMATTSVCSVFALSQRFSRHFQVSKSGLIAAITLVACLPAQLGFAKLVGTVYPLIGCLGLPILGSILVQLVKTRMNLG